MSGQEQCHNCGEPYTGTASLPVNDAGLYVPVGDTKQQWGGVPACEQCNELYVAAGDQCNEVLSAYEEATQALRDRLQALRQALSQARHVTDTALRFHGEPRPS